GYPQTNRKIDTGKTLTRWPVFVDHFKPHGKGRRGEKADDRSDKQEQKTKTIERHRNSHWIGGRIWKAIIRYLKIVSG
ncbi:hypothetical protein M8N37_07970, partial [Enterobacter kobei]|uniref:hypothetical protein n=1 Tax=Enterobacter kobei TaxID=208224 RepID=UPI0033065B6A|nr:hypothetical protein [Enterobacter kobei]